ncbi:hypothetical protein C0J52_25619 [Blattella germanica]|nr:hypothetical protein C0J52_25619 [Blattella germanica]
MANLWAFMFADKAITHTRANCLDMLQLFLEPQLQRDGILPSYDNIVGNYLNKTFPNRWIGRAAGRMLVAQTSRISCMGFHQELCLCY